MKPYQYHVIVRTVRKIDVNGNTTFRCSCNYRDIKSKTYQGVFGMDEVLETYIYEKIQGVRFPHLKWIITGEADGFKPNEHFFIIDCPERVEA